jgi:RimJ/RimL family protein N-acetyltransferase
MGYWLGKPFWGQGIMPEAVKEMLRHAFEDLDMQKVWCGYYECNAKSKRVQEKCGFRYQWRSENVDVPLMHEKRTGHVSLMTKEDWEILERNERAGVVYHREGITGDYDDFDDLEELIDFIKTGKKMSIDLKPIAREDIETVWKMQVEAFSDLLEKYQDYDMSPAAEDMDKVLARFEQPWTTYFFIMANNEKVGVIRVVDKKDGSRKRISPIWIMPEYRNKGYAQQAILAAEKKYGSNHWCLDTILQE